MSYRSRPDLEFSSEKFLKIYISWMSTWILYTPGMMLDTDSQFCSVQAQLLSMKVTALNEGHSGHGQ